MNCKNCGAFIPEGTRFCASCGAEVIEEPTQYVVEKPQYQQYDTNYGLGVAAEVAAAAKSVLVWGILGLAFACSFYLSLLGIIFSAVGLSKAKKYVAANGALVGKAKVGRGLAIAGLIVGIVLTVIFVLVVVGLAYAATMGYTYY